MMLLKESHSTASEFLATEAGLTRCMAKGGTDKEGPQKRLCVLSIARIISLCFLLKSIEGGTGEKKKKKRQGFLHLGLFLCLLFTRLKTAIGTA